MSLSHDPQREDCLEAAGPYVPSDELPVVLTPPDHPIRAGQIHPNVRFICHRLVEQGFTALVVGGAVRDLLVGRHPKDFDLVTSARPEAVRALFRNARIIGRRFRLVELRFPNMAVEVSTFRSEPRSKRGGMIRRDNTYGTPEEDAFRRDFTVNALSFDPLSLTLFDYVGALRDLRERVIRTIKPPAESFAEDPVRMLRAVRFKVRLGFELDSGLEAVLRKRVRRLEDVTRHRLAEEMQRFLTRGNAFAAYVEFDRLGLLKPLLGLRRHTWFFASKAVRSPLPVLRPLLERMDGWSAEGPEPMPPTVALLALLLTLASEENQTLLLEGDTRRQSLPPAYAGRLSAFLSDWGLLNGQVEPALLILSSARRLIVAARKGKGTPSGPEAPPGTREAWLLLAALPHLVDLDEAFVRRGVQRLAELPDLPILDHPRPSNRLAVPRSLPRKTAAVAGEADATPSPSRTGRKRRPGTR